jgi:hypothetical protein
VVLLLGVTAAGWPYYTAPMSERVRSTLHPWLRPSGYVGQTAGILALLAFAFLWLYPLRKRFRRLAFTGSMVAWLNVHVTVALLLPLVAAVHAGWRFEGLIGLGYAFMMVVWLSGLVGRYLYAHIPRGVGGLELTREQIAAERCALVVEIAARAGLPAERVEAALNPPGRPAGGAGIAAALGRMARDDLAAWRASRALRRLSTPPGVPKAVKREVLAAVGRLARRETALARQVRMLDATRRVFHLWHVVHRPFALAALLAVMLHVAVAVALGATWFR